MNLLLNKKILLLGIFLSIGCVNTRRIRNYNWELDSLRYYILKMDSMITSYGKEIQMLKTDINIRLEEITVRLEKTNERLKEQEEFISAKLGSFKEKVDVIPNEEKSFYDAASLHYVKGNYNESIKGFSDFLKKFPYSKLAENALYLLGDSYLALGKRQDAIDKFLELINKFPQGLKVPTALYKIGVIYESANDKRNANIYFERVLLEYPDSPEATLAKNRLNQ